MKTPFDHASMVASSTDAVGTIPAHFAEYLAPYLNLAAFVTPLPLPRIELSQYWHERVHNDEGHRWFRSAIRTLFGSPAPKVFAKPRSRAA